MSTEYGEGHNQGYKDGQDSLKIEIGSLKRTQEMVAKNEKMFELLKESIRLFGTRTPELYPDEFEYIKKVKAVID